MALTRPWMSAEIDYDSLPLRIPSSPDIKIYARIVRESGYKVCDIAVIMQKNSWNIPTGYLARASTAKDFGSAMRNRNVTSVHYGQISASFMSSNAR